MKKEKIIKVVIVEPSQPARVEIIQDIIINEEGKFIDLEPNFGIYDGQDYVAGTAIFAGVDYEEGEFKSLSDQQVKGILFAFSGRNEEIDV